MLIVTPVLKNFGTVQSEVSASTATFRRKRRKKLTFEIKDTFRFQAVFTKKEKLAQDSCPRDDYKEVLELVLFVLGHKPKGFHFKWCYQYNNIKYCISCEMYIWNYKN